MLGGDKQAVTDLDPIFKTLAPGLGNIPRTPGMAEAGGTAEAATSIAVHPAPDISSRWFTTASSTA